jgi:hypothetical protein
MAKINISPIKLSKEELPPYMIVKNMTERYNPKDIPFSALY